jgi:iron(II)-dependent oxidoreductase
MKALGLGGMMAGWRRKAAILAMAWLWSQVAWAGPGEGLPREVVIRDVEFVLVPEGWFYKSGGVPRGEEADGGNAKIWLDSFYIAKFEARARDLGLFLNEQSGRDRQHYGGDFDSCSLRKSDGGQYELVKPQEDLPATHLSWNLANEWARWMGFRLPTEAEWEKAARGTDQRIYPWGNDYPDETYANFYTPSNCLVWPVDRPMKGRSPYGAYNMAGNVREYVADWYNPAQDALFKDGARNPALAAEGAPTAHSDRPLKLLKGGRWAANSREMMVFSRVTTSPERSFQCNGTRFALDATMVRDHLAKGTARVVVP